MLAFACLLSDALIFHGLSSTPRRPHKTPAHTVKDLLQPEIKALTPIPTRQHFVPVSRISYISFRFRQHPDSSFFLPEPAANLPAKSLPISTAFTAIPASASPLNRAANHTASPRFVNPLQRSTSSSHVTPLIPRTTRPQTSASASAKGRESYSAESCLGSTPCIEFRLIS